LLPKIRISATMVFMSAPDQDLPSVERGRESRHFNRSMLFRFPEEEARKRSLAAKRPQPIEKSRFGRENPRKSKEKRPRIQRKSNEFHPKSGIIQRIPNFAAPGVTGTPLRPAAGGKLVERAA
jgi:hypothetical protein